MRDYFTDRARIGLCSWALIAWGAMGLQSFVLGQSLESHFVAMDDGVRLAADVHLPAKHQPDQRYPALLELTRYWRSAVDPVTGKSPPGQDGLNRYDRGFLENGYVIVKVDVRGSGALFGQRLEEYGPRSK